ncbi:hypothetical protein T484DRAFT_1662840 [Baffinella frigidus]|nr:hypothetical protein T484DRAFT_1662840 [Cryptophyta sp. CCMP2293]
MEESAPPSNGRVLGDEKIGEDWPSPVGLFSGIFAVAVAQVVVIAYHYWHLRQGWPMVQGGKPDHAAFWRDALEHIAQPEGFVLLAAYLAGTWMFRLMPASYYSWEGGVSFKHLAMQLLINDLFQTAMHLGEHKVSSWVYRKSHKPHHKFLSPKMFDAFNGSVTDTIFMILLPLFITAQAVHCNVWSYMAFGATFASWLTLIHSEMQHPWDPLFQKIGFGTAADHHVHHRCFVFNYGNPPTIQH